MTDPAPATTRRRRRGSIVLAIVAVLAVAGAVGSRQLDNPKRADGPADGSPSSGQVVGDVDVADSGGGSTGAAKPALAASGASAYDAATPEPTIASTDAGADRGAGSGTTSAAPAGTTVEPKVVRTGSIEVRVRKGGFDAAVQAATAVANDAGGFVASSETDQLGDHPSGSLTLRVPAARFDAAVARLKRLGKVTAVTTGSQDVTGEYTDVAARIRSLRDEREQVRLVLAGAKTIPEILSVRDRLSAVQVELEQLQGRQQVLDDQTSLATLTVQLSERGHPAPAPEPEAERSAAARLWSDAAHQFGQGLRAIVLGLATLAPWLLVGGAVLLAARRWRRPEAAERPVA